MYVLAGDIGTGSAISIIVDVGTGKIVSESSVDYKPGFEVPREHPNGAEQWPDPWWEAMQKTAREAIGKSAVDPADIGALCYSGLYGGSGIPVDSEVKPIRPCMIWLDQRAFRECDLLRDEIGEDFFGEVSGNYTLHSYYGYTKMFWFMVNEPRLFQKTRYFVTPNGYVIHKLTGRLVTDYCSMGNFAGVFDIDKYEVSQEALDRLTALARKKVPSEFSDIELRADMFGDLVSSDDVVGEVDPQMADSIGVKPGTPVVASGIDAPVSLVATGGVGPGFNGLMTGTSWCWGMLQDRPEALYARRLINYPHAIRSRNLIYSFGGGAFPGGAVDPWFRTNLGGGLNTKELDGLAAEVPPGSLGIIFHPFLMGERTPVWNTSASGGFFGLRHLHTAGAIYRSVLEGAAYLHRWNVEQAEQAGIVINTPTLLVDGGSKSPLWRSILADVLDMQMEFLAEFPGTPYGDALIGAVGIGEVEPDVIHEWLPEKLSVQPSPKNKAVYEKGYTAFKGIYEKMVGIYPDFYDFYRESSDLEK
jgi:xylulokinase